MNRNKTLYSKIVALKKRYMKTRIIPHTLGVYVDTFFNSTHNFIIQTRDRIRDISIRSKDLIRDTSIKSKDVLRDTAIRSKDITRDISIRTFDTTRDVAVVSKDTLRDFSFRARVVITRDLFYFIVTLLKSLVYSIDEKSDKKAVSSMNVIVANSRNVQKRVLTYYGREAKIVYPPITIPESVKNENGDFWLSVNRITPEKRVHLQVRAFRKLPHEKLIIVGGFDNNTRSLAETLSTTSPKNVVFKGAVDNNTLESLYAQCKGLITTSIDEDFGMNVVEAMSYGKPVIAPNEGGYRETVVHGKTGLLLNNIDEQKIVRAIKEIQNNIMTNNNYYINSCRNRAEEFSVEKFVERIKEITYTYRSEA